MVAPNNDEPDSGLLADKDQASRRWSERRLEILQALVHDSVKLRLQGNDLFKDGFYKQALKKYDEAVHAMRQVPKGMGAADLVKALNNRGRAYFKLVMLAPAEADACEVLSMDSVEKPSKATAFLLRYNARLGLGATNEAMEDLKRAASLDNADAKRLANASAQRTIVAAAQRQTSLETLDGTANGPALAEASPSMPNGLAAAIAAPQGRRSGAHKLRMRARPGARAGEELTFGGIRDMRPWGDCPVPEAISPVRTTMSTAPRVFAGAGGREDKDIAGENSAGGETHCNSGGSIVDTCHDEGGIEGGVGSESSASSTATGREGFGRRRPRPESFEGGFVCAATFTPNRTADTDIGTFPAPHPLLAHAAVKRCRAPFEGDDLEDRSSRRTYADEKGLGAPCSDGNMGGVEARSEGDRTGEQMGVTDAAGTAALDHIGIDGQSDDARASPPAQGQNCTDGGNVGASAAAVGAYEEDDNPSPAKQAQDIRWLVEQAKAKPAEGDIWAVLDRQWWLRWQTFAGCHEQSTLNGVPAKCSAQTSSEGPASSSYDAGSSSRGMSGSREADSDGGGDSETSFSTRTAAGKRVSSTGSGVGDAAKPSVSVATSSSGACTTDESGGGGGGGGDSSAEAIRHDDRGVAPAVAGASDCQASEEPLSAEDDSTVRASDSDASDDSSACLGGGSRDLHDRRPSSTAAAPHSSQDAGGKASSGERISVAEDSKLRPAGDCGDDLTLARPRVPPPGPIDNSSIVLGADAPGTTEGTGRRLRLRLVRGYHFVLVPQEAWKALHAWYGGGPALPRALVPVEDSESGLVVYEPQLYPEFSRLDPILRSTLATRRHPDGRRMESPGASEPLANGNAGSEGRDAAASAGTGSTSEGDHLSNGVRPPASGAPPAGETTGGAQQSEGEGTSESGDSREGGPTGARDGGAVAPVPVTGVEPATNENKKAIVHPCSACGRPAALKCTSCAKNTHFVWYCSRPCQTAHWRYHKRSCGGRDPEAGLALAKRGKAGLNNLGNTCFLNSAVQCLSHVQPLTRHILTNAFLGDLNTSNPLGTGGHLVRAYEHVLKDLWFGTASSVSPTGLKSAIAKFAPRFNGYSQQDSQEVLSFLLDGLHEDLNRVLKKPYLALPDGECGRPDEVIAAKSWDMFKMRDRSVLVDNLYGQFKSTLECQQCGKLSRKFDEFNVMPVELLDGQRLQVILDFAPLLTRSVAGRQHGQPTAASILAGKGLEGRRPRRVGVLLPREALVSDLKDELAEMFQVETEELVIVVVPASGRPVYHALPDTAQVSPFTRGYDMTAHECIPGRRHALVINRVFDSGRHLAGADAATLGGYAAARWAEGVHRLDALRHGDREAPFLVSFPENVSCLGLVEVIWSYMGDFLLISEEDHEKWGPHLAQSGLIKVSEARDLLFTKSAPADQAAVEAREKTDLDNGVAITATGRYIPPAKHVPAAAVLDVPGRKRQSLDCLRLNWSGQLLENMNESRVNEPYGASDHSSVRETGQRAKRVSLQGCLEKFSVPETLCEDNSWYCGNCKELRQAIKTIQVWSLPEVLVLHFKRFSHAGTNRGKVELFVDFPINGLDMSPYCRGETLEGGRPMSALYDLFAVSNHMGGMGHGHYTAFVRDWDGSGMSPTWHVCDDHECRPVQESRVRTPHAYVLFYRRRPLS